MKVDDKVLIKLTPEGKWRTGVLEEINGNNGIVILDVVSMRVRRPLNEIRLCPSFRLSDLKREDLGKLTDVDMVRLALYYHKKLKEDH